MEPNTASLVQAISAVVSAGTTIVLVALTGWYVRLTAKMVAAMREVREPAVEIDIEIDDDMLLLVVANRGASAATNVQLGVKSPLPWLEQNGTLLTCLPAFKDGLDYLAPGRVLKFRAGSIDWSRMKDAEGVFAASLSFENGAGEVFPRAVRIDVGQYEGVTVTSFTSPLESIAESLRDMNRRELMADVERRTMRGPSTGAQGAHPSATAS